MNLLIPKDRAINILRQRISDLNDFHFNSKAWKDRTILDVKEIFGEFSNQWLQVYGLNFETYVSTEKQKVLNEGKQTANILLYSYIDFINEYSQIGEQKEVVKEQCFEEKFMSLLKKWNELVPDYNDLINK
ncbi:MAG TPA: hypothetical protein VE978_27880 [Chitinophagales bacterium]|nr:hypothetical protein [Chitinophagales bacterium]